MIKLSAIDHINLSVSDLERSVDFYKRVFGFKIVEDQRNAEPNPWAIVGVAGAAYLALHQTPLERAEDGLAINHFGLVADDIEAALAHLLQEEANVLFQDREEGPIIDWGKSFSIYIKDPDGHNIELTSKFGGGL
jgi:lactoylglutathione lyase